MDDRSESPLPDPSFSDNHVKWYIEASAESADRARFVLLVLVTASILAFVAAWNSRPGGWTPSRLVVATDGQRFFKNGKSILPDKEVVDQRVLPDTFSGEVDKQLSEPEREVWRLFFSQADYDELNEQKKKDAYLDRRYQAFKSARRFAAQSRFADLEHMKKYVEHLERTRTERIVNITVPFFGIVFDVNYLGVFAGVTFAIVLILFRFSLLRELRNLKMVFAQTKTLRQRELCYNLLAMQQVLTIPPRLVPEKRKSKVSRALDLLRGLLWEYLPKLLYLLPLAAHSVIFYNDYTTYQDVEKVYPGTVVIVLVNGILLGVNLLLTGLCLYLGWKVDKSWRDQAEDIRRSPKKESLGRRLWKRLRRWLESHGPLKALRRLRQSRKQNNPHGVGTLSDTLEDFGRTIEEAAERLRAMPEAAAGARGAAGVWSAKETIGHLIDSAANNHQRFVRAQFTDDLVFPGYVQDEWIAAQHYQDASWGRLVELWRLYNLHLLHVVSRIPSENLKRPRRPHSLDKIAFRVVGEDEAATLEYLIRDYVEHLKHHLDQIKTTD